MNLALLSRRMAFAIIALFGAWIMNPLPVQADTEVWDIQSSFPFQVELQFYSQDRNAVWPGGGKAFLLDDSKMHKFSLECKFGEKVCYGAWEVMTGNKTGRKYWGVGQNDGRHCTSCCWTCGLKGEPRAINLVR